MARVSHGLPGIYNSSVITLSTEEGAALALDSSGRVILSPGGALGYAVEHSAMPATPSVLPVGGEYRLAADTYTDGDTVIEHYDVNGNKLVSLGTALDKAIDSVTNYAAGCTMTEVDLATDADVVVTASPCYLLGIYVNVVLSAHAVNIIDNVTTKLILPASLAAGTKIDCQSATFATNLSVNSDNAATGKIVIFWRAA